MHANANAMLAPRKVLWSTPDAVIRQLCHNEVVMNEILNKNNKKVVCCDIGCGDGRVLFELAKFTTSQKRQRQRPNHSTTQKQEENVISFVGIDADPNRIEQCQNAWNSAVQVAKTIDESFVQARFHCANAITETHLWNDATLLYVYLTPRGLRALLRTIQLSNINNNNANHHHHLYHSLRCLISYMNPVVEFHKQDPNQQKTSIVGVDPVQTIRQLVHVPHQPETKWPLYIYRFGTHPKNEKQDIDT